MKKILFISGSLRKESFNKQLLEMAAQRLSSDFECTFLDYGDLPLLNQDEEFPAPAAVQRIRSLVASADARPVKPGDYSTAVGREKAVAVSSVAGSSAGSFSIAKLVELLEMLGCTLVQEKTMIALGARFGQVALVLGDDEQALLERECEAVKEMLHC